MYCRYGREPNYYAYIENLEVLCKKLHEVLPDYCIFLWLTAMPLGQAARGGFLTKDVEYSRPLLAQAVRQANLYASRVMGYYGFEVIDLHYRFWYREAHRVADGIHWDSTAHRVISTLILNHAAKCWKISLPVKFNGGIKHLHEKAYLSKLPLTNICNVPSNHLSLTNVCNIPSNNLTYQSPLIPWMPFIEWSEYPNKILQHNYHNRYYGRRTAPYRRN